MACISGKVRDITVPGFQLGTLGAAFESLLREFGHSNFFGEGCLTFSAPDAINVPDLSRCVSLELQYGYRKPVLMC